MRIVSLLPSASDIIVALGARDSLVGVSHSCGPGFDDLPKLTSTSIDVRASSADIDEQVRQASGPLYTLNLDLLAELQPDVIVSQSLCEVCAVSVKAVEEAVEQLGKRPIVVNLAPFRLHDIAHGFLQVGEAIGRVEEARRLQLCWDRRLALLHNLYATQAWRVAFLDWLNPLFIAGHWIPDMISWLGMEPVIAKAGQASFPISFNTLKQAKPDYVIAACCGFSEQRSQLDQESIDLPVHILDGYEHFNRPSPVLMQSFDLIVRLFDTLEPEARGFPAHSKINEWLSPKFD